MTSPIAATGRSTYSPFDLVKPSKPLLCITTGTPNTPPSLTSFVSTTRSQIKTNDRNKQDAQLSQRDRAAGCVIVFAKSRRLELGDNILRTV